MGSPCRPGVGRGAAQDELFAWHRLKLWPRRPPHHNDMSHPKHPRDPQCNCQHLLSHSVVDAGFDTLPSVQPLVPPRRGSTCSPSPLPPPPAGPPLSTPPRVRTPSSTSSHSSSRRAS